MAEINGDEEKDAAPEEPPSPAAEDQAEDLDDEQQAALDKIMAEINSDDQVDASSEDGSKAVSEKSTNPPEDHDAGAEAQEDDTAASVEGDNQEPLQTKLSLEEFNDELTNLLTQADSSENKTAGKETAKYGPDEVGGAVEEASESSTSMEENSPSVSQTDPNVAATGTETTNDYAMLQEVTSDESTTSGQGRQKRPRRARKTKVKTGKGKRLLLYPLAAMLIIGSIAAIYWYYGFPPKKTATVPLLAEVPNTAPPPALHENSAPLPSSPGKASVPTPSEVASMVSSQQDTGPISSPLSSLRETIASTREQIMLKIEEVKELQAYYQNGANESRKKIVDSPAFAKSGSRKTIPKNREIELDLRAIQRRLVYVEKLKIPIKELTSASEELLYFERKTQLFEALQKGVTGLSIEAFEKEVTRIIETHSNRSGQLSIDHIDVEAPPLTSIWAGLQSRTDVKPAKQRKINTEQDDLIHQEICRGNFERKYLLTALRPKSAQCLTKWPGKDLYLNSLVKLPPSIAKTLSQWPGEWLSLNGLKDLPDESAKYLSQWKGKRLSLNGLTQLSQKATRHLSKWKGEQLEMVGLTAIGRWENYGTHLYLSENLRRKLQLQ